DFTPASLRGKVWVAHFFYTTCTGGCTKTAPTMMALQKAFAGKSDVALVSISLNNDTPEALERYARDLGADPKQWLVLTGFTTEVHRIVQEVFKQSAVFSDSKEPGKEIAHSFNLDLVDASGNIRGYVDGQDPDNVASIESRVRSLVREKFLLPAVNASL